MKAEAINYKYMYSIYYYIINNRSIILYNIMIYCVYIYIFIVVIY